MKDHDESTTDLLRKIPEDLKQLVSKRIELIELQITEKAASVASRLFYKVAGALFLYLALALLLWAGGFYLGQLLNNVSAGFAVMGLIVAFIGIILFKYHTKGMVRIAKNMIVRAILDDKYDQRVTGIEKKEQ
jgi:hypothetical protein